jgi:hypothetical protein
MAVFAPAPRTQFRQRASAISKKPASPIFLVLRWKISKPGREYALNTAVFSTSLMNTILLRSLLLFALLAFGRVASSAADPAAAWQAADDARVAAMISADPAKIAATFSDDLLYVHSSGSSDTKASLSAAITSGRSKYNAITYEQREFREIVPGLVHMTGRGKFLLGKVAPFNELHLSFLAAYRLEKGV